MMMVILNPSKSAAKIRNDFVYIRVAQLREEQNIKHSEMTNFTQSSVLKIEKRKDMKIYTLIDYLDSLGKGKYNVFKTRFCKNLI